jgi:5'-nucleotidase / UDP-sugar diphosphatase
MMGFTRQVSTALLCALAISLAPAQPKKLLILHTNDMHASFIPHEALWSKAEPKPLVGGFVELAAAVDSMRGLQEPTLLLDAGDVMTGNPITERVYAGAKGGALLAMMNMIGYDVWEPGNHDFDVSQENMRALVHIAKFPTVNANLVDKDNKPIVSSTPYVILKRGGLRIGVVGLMSQELYGLVNQNNLTGIRVLAPAEVLQRIIDEIDPATDLIIALTHMGADQDSLLASAVHGLDIIVGGHSHTRLRTPSRVNGVLIVQAGSNAENLGRLEVTVEDDHVVSSSGSLLQLWVHQHHEATPLSHLVDSLKEEIDREYSQVIATLSYDWTRGSGETDIGQFLANAQREAAGAEVGFMNKFGIRKDMKAGPMTKRDLFEIIPFANALTTFQLSGRELRTVLLHYVEHNPGIEINGVDAEWKLSRDGRTEFRSITVQGKTLDDDRQYTCGASDYFVGEAKRYLGVDVPRPIILQRSVFDVVEEAVQKAHVIGHSVTTRITKAP